MRNIVKVKEIQKQSRKLEVAMGWSDWQVLVRSASQPIWYQVNFSRDYTDATCTCKWAQIGGRNCKHVMAALDWIRGEGRLSF